MENIRNYIDVELVKTKERAQKLVDKNQKFVPLKYLMKI